MNDTSIIHLPDLISICPFSWSLSQHFPRGSDESAHWANSYNIFSDRKRAYFVMANGGLLASYVYSSADYEEFRTCCDFINLLYVLDELSDDQDEDEARETENSFIRALNGEPCDGSPLSLLVNDFMERLQTAAPRSRQRFIEHCKDYFKTVVQEADLRSRNTVFGIEDYIVHRRENGGVKPCFDLFEYIFSIELPDELFCDPAFMKCYDGANDMICLSNDIYSYAVEHQRGLDGNNAVTILMRTKGLTVQEAVDWLGSKFRVVMEEFIISKRRIRSYGPEIDAAIQLYVSGMEQWVAANLAWSFDTQRYFGAAHQEVKQNLVVELKHPSSTKCH